MKMQRRVARHLSGRDPRKKNAFRALSALFLSITLVFCLASCYDVIFYKIENEVKLEDANILGEIHDIVRFTSGSDEYLYIDNGQIRYKPVNSTDNDDWQKHMTGIQKLEYDYYDTEFDGVQIIKVACDTSNLYALGVEWEVDEDEGENMPKAWVLYTSSGPLAKWEEMWRLERSDTRINKRYLEHRGAVSLFCTNTYDAANRTAYLRTSLPSSSDRYVPETTIYSLNGNSAPAKVASPHYVLASDTYNNALTHDAAFFGGTVYFMNYSSDYSTIGTDETLSAAATHIYYSYADKLYYSANGSSWTKGSDVSSAIISIAMTSDYFILGTRGDGLVKVRNTSGVPGGTVDFETNAEVALGHPYMIRSLHCVDPEKSELEAVIYATADFRGSRGSTTGSTDDIGLWSYYPRRGNWNRE